MYTFLKKKKLHISQLLQANTYSILSEAYAGMQECIHWVKSVWRYVTWSSFVCNTQGKSMLKNVIDVNSW